MDALSDSAAAPVAGLIFNPPEPSRPQATERTRELNIQDYCMARFGHALDPGQAQQVAAIMCDREPPVLSRTDPRFAVCFEILGLVPLPFRADDSIKVAQDAMIARETEALVARPSEYHLFLGHRQIDSNRTVGELDEIFKVLGLRCWRDLSQPVQDERAMIRVVESSVYTLYLTNDALSYFVTLEARAAMTLGKPVVVFIEDDKRLPSYAGGSVESATSGWPDDLVTYFQTGQFIGWGGQPYQWNHHAQNARLRDTLERCVAMEVPVPLVGASWVAALAALDGRQPTRAPTDDGGTDGQEVPDGGEEVPVDYSNEPVAPVEAPVIDRDCDMQPKPDPECGNCGRPHADEIEQRNCEYFGRAAARRWAVNVQPTLQFSPSIRPSSLTCRFQVNGPAAPHARLSHQPLTFPRSPKGYHPSSARAACRSALYRASPWAQVRLDA